MLNLSKYIKNIKIKMEDPGKTRKRHGILTGKPHCIFGWILLQEATKLKQFSYVFSKSIILG
jgi:hypothetical protein